MLHSRLLSDRVTFIRLFRILSTSSLEGPKARNDFINQLSGLLISLEVDFRLRRPRALLPRSSHPDMRRCLAAEIFEHKFNAKRTLVLSLSGYPKKNSMFREKH